MPYEACFQLSHPLRFKTLGTNSWYQLIQATHEPMHSKCARKKNYGTERELPHRTTFQPWSSVS